MALYDKRGNYLVGGQLPLTTREGPQIPSERALEQHPERLPRARRIHPILAYQLLNEFEELLKQGKIDSLPEHCACSARGQRFGDRIAKTYVTKSTKH